MRRGLRTSFFVFVTSARPASGFPPKVQSHRAAYMRRIEHFFAAPVPPLPDY